MVIGIVLVNHAAHFIGGVSRTAVTIALIWTLRVSGLLRGSFFEAGILRSKMAGRVRWEVAPGAWPSPVRRCA